MAEADKSPEISGTDRQGELASLLAAARASGARGLPPVHLWNPPHCGDIGLKISRDGLWHYQGSPIGRMPLVKLFASILRRDGDEHVLVTPAEKVSVAVEDAPFLAVEMAVEWAGEAGQTIAFRTNVDDIVRLGAQNPMRFAPGASDGLKPYILVRGDLWALASRPVFYELVELGETAMVEGVEMFGVRSQGSFFAMCRASSIGEWA
ncbi:MAG: DUF1285 domain-containing protein [Alphaproteobacteria bacterium]|nr:DUF1285 domain-containing protein [Alphaproteobacteria bacterium]